MTESPKERDQRERDLMRRPGPSDYEVRHYGHRRMFAVWWTCRSCHEQVPPFVGHGHLR